jgi:flagellar basal body-associated protein FliL
MTMTMSPQAAAQSSAAQGAADEEPEGEKKKGKGKMIIIGLVGALVVGFGAWTMVLKPMLFPPHYKPGQAVPAGKIVPLAQNTINLSDGHLLQVTVAMQLTAPAQTATLAEDDPKFLNAEIDVFGALTMPDLLNPAGRTAAQTALLAAFQKIAGLSEGAQQISAVYFTSFVTQ